MKVDILAIGVHPDDVELSCSGTLLKHIKIGHTVAILDLTRGELGTKGNADLRMKEAKAAADIMGVKYREQAGLEDGFFQYSQENIKAIIPYIRKFQPEIVLTNAPKDRHPDHGRAAKLTADACFYSGLIKIKTQWEGQDQEAWRPRAVYHYIQDDHLTPDFVVDITSEIDQKIDAIMAYKSQFYNKNDDGPETPISQKNFIDSVKGKNAVFGRSIRVDFAEGFICDRIPGIDNLMDLV